MKTSFKAVVGIMLLCLVLLAMVSALLPWFQGPHRQRAVADTRQALRAQGFKTDPADFKFTADDATRARAAALQLPDPPLKLDEHGYRSDLFLPPVSDDTATILWKQDTLKIWSRVSDWSRMHAVLDPERELLDAACDAALAGSIRLDLEASHFGDTLENLTPALSGRVLLELRDGHPDAAWTNLLAATRLATAWEAGPPGTSHLFRSHLAEVAFADTWQALQHAGWPDSKLAVLQHEWESANFFTNLAETAAFDCMDAVNECHIEAGQPPLETWTYSALCREMISNPMEGFAVLEKGRDRMRYSSYGAFVDEMNLLLYFQNRALQLRHAIQSSTWAEMRAQPGVTNPVPFESVFQDLENHILFRYVELNLVPARAAEAEARRRIAITALALERYRGKHGAYPVSLAPLAPEFLAAVPVDFMDGQPLRYRLANDGHFLLYSVGLDCVDNGGKMPLTNAQMFPINDVGMYEAPKNIDIVWPRPAL